jgi:hypothetical protein
VRKQDAEKTHIPSSIYKHIGQGRNANNTCPKSLYFSTQCQHYQSISKTKDSMNRKCGEQLTAPTQKAGIGLRMNLEN